MTESINTFGLFMQTAVQMGTPFLFATVGGILCEKVGNMNLGIEGMMLMGAVMGFITGLSTGNATLSIIVAGLAGATGALLYAIVTVTLRGNQTVTGLALTVFGTGLANFLGQGLAGQSLPLSLSERLASFDVPFLSDIPVIGKMFFSQSIYVYLGLAVAVICYIYLYKTRFGLNTRMVGENAAAADASGINVTRYKYANILSGGFLCGLAGAYFSLVFVPRWQENITAGAGWIAVALIVFATWNPLRAIFGAYFFGALKSIGFKLQNISFTFAGNSFTLAPQLLDMIPYIATIMMLVLITIRKRQENMAPRDLGTPYFREDR